MIKENRQVLLELYNALIASLLEEIKHTNNIELAIDFFCGVLEGDGSVPSKTHGHITIATNKHEYKAIEDVIKVTGIKSKTTFDSPNRVSIRIGSLEILRNFDHLKDKIFAFYPKRKRMLFERLQTVGAVKFLMEQNHEPTGWVKAWLKKNGFVDNNYELTKKGLKLRKDLKTCIKSVAPTSRVAEAWRYNPRIFKGRNIK